MKMRRLITSIRCLLRTGRIPFGTGSIGPLSFIDGRSDEGNSWFAESLRLANCKDKMGMALTCAFHIHQIQCKTSLTLFIFQHGKISSHKTLTLSPLRFHRKCQMEEITIIDNPKFNTFIEETHWKWLLGKPDFLGHTLTKYRM